MNLHKPFIALALCLFALSGCEDKASLSGSATPGATKEISHAPTDAEPGSHDDWCGEHQVPESLCSRCNPSLVAAFKASGDWCEEHSLPESQCFACNPDLKIERPPKDQETSK